MRVDLYSIKQLRGGKMIEHLQPAPPRYWKYLLQAVVVDTACSDLSQRIQEAQDAVMDEIETCYPTATDSERQSLVNALNALCEFRRMCETSPPGRRLKQISQSNEAQA
jgi:hypothetical protein